MPDVGRFAQKETIHLDVCEKTMITEIRKFLATEQFSPSEQTTLETWVRVMEMGKVRFGRRFTPQELLGRA